MRYAVILAGGRGTRFWPLSRRALPKQCLSLDGGPTLIQRTVNRIAPLISPERTLVVTGPDMVDAVREQLPALPPANFLVEPSARNTAPAAAWTAWEVARRHRDAGEPGPATICVLPSDHVIEDEPGFRSCLSTALDAASANGIVIIGIKPTRPETGFGYIEPDGTGPVRGVRRFVEKPDAASAERLIAGGCLWNAGMFCWRADVLQAAARAFMPRTAAAMDALASGARALGGADGAWAETEATSVDYGILERSRDIRVVPGDFGWSDVGSWPALEGVLPREAWGCGPAEVEAVRSARNVVYSRGRLVALLGVEDLVVVDTPDVLLVAHKAEGQRVKDVLDRLEARAPGRYD